MQLMTLSVGWHSVTLCTANTHTQSCLMQLCINMYTHTAPAVHALESFFIFYTMKACPKGKWTSTPNSVNFPFIHPFNLHIHPQTHSPLTLLSFLNAESSRQAETHRGLRQQRKGKREVLSSNFLLCSDANSCAFRPVLVWVTVANHKRVECHLLVHNLNPLSSLHHHLSTLPPPTDTVALDSYTLTHHMFFTHAQRKSQFECTQTPHARKDWHIGISRCVRICEGAHRCSCMHKYVRDHSINNAKTGKHWQLNNNKNSYTAE